jgi:hypothetical protein
MMSTPRRLTSPALAAIRTCARRYNRWLEDLIHAVKSELVGRFDRVDHRIDQLEASVDSSHVATSDQLSMLAIGEQRLRQTTDQTLESTTEIQASATRIQESTAQIQAEVEAATVEVGTVRAEMVRELTATRLSLEAARDGIRMDMLTALSEAAPSIRLRQLSGARLRDIDEDASRFLNYINSAVSPLTDAGLWINHPVLIEWAQGAASVRWVNERIIEQPFVFAALADLPPGARLLDVGGGESTVALSLASSGYDVTVIEPMGYPFEHPNLTVFEKPLEQFDEVGPFDAVIALSAIEHFGIGHYDGSTEVDAEADHAAMARIAELTGSTGRLVMTIPYGRAQVTDLERIYDRELLTELLSGWTIDRLTVGERVDDRTWQIVGDELVDPGDQAMVVMLAATLAASA